MRTSVLKILAPYKDKIARNDFTWMSEDGPRLTKYLTDLILLFTQAGIEPFVSIPTKQLTRLLSLIRGVTAVHTESYIQAAEDREQLIRFAQVVGLEVYKIDDPHLNTICSHFLLFVRPGQLREVLSLPHIQTLLGHPKEAVKKLIRIQAEREAK